MLKHKEIDISISYRNITHYIKKGYQAKLHETLTIKTSDLPNVSHQKIVAICESCCVENIIAYHKYLENKNRCGYYGCRSCSRKKSIKTSQDKWGVDNWMQLSESKEIVANNNIKKYGVKTTLLEKSTKEKIVSTIREKYGVSEILELDSIRHLSFIKRKELGYLDNFAINDEFIRYKNKVNRLSKKNYKFLFSEWDGFDYYDNEFIKNNKSLHHNDYRYPTVDHKIPILWGYRNNINPEILADLSNLCITKRSINSTKSAKYTPDN